MYPNLPPSDRIALLGVVNPSSQSPGSASTGWVKADTCLSYLALIQTGTLGTAATVDAKLEQAKDASGTGAKDIDGKSITQLTKAGSDDDKQVLINLRPDELDVNNEFTHFRLTITVGAAASLVSGVVLGLDPRYNRASDNDVTSVDEIIP